MRGGSASGGRGRERKVEGVRMGGWQGGTISAVAELVVYRGSGKLLGAVLARKLSHTLVQAGGEKVPGSKQPGCHGRFFRQSFLSRPTRRHSQDTNILVLKGREHPSDAIEAAGKATEVRGSGGGDTPLPSWALGSRLRAIVCKAASGDSREVRGGDAVCLGNSSRHAACCHGQ